MKILVIVAAIAVSVFANAQGQSCNFDPVVACNHCDFSRSYVQYVPNACNCNEYYSCEKTRGHITAHKQVCPPCLCFSSVTWGCTIYNGQDCPTEPPITEIVEPEGPGSCYRYGNGPQGDYLQRYQVGDKDYTFNWIVNDFPVKMRCPAGTYFNLTLCQCVHCVPDKDCAQDDTNVFCLDWENQNSERGIWYNQDASCSINNNYLRGSPNHELHLPGYPCTVEIPYFQNNEFSEFKLCGWFKASNLGHEQGLAYYGGGTSFDCYPASIYIKINPSNQVVAGIETTDVPTSFSTFVGTVVAGREYRVCLRYTGAVLELILTDVATNTVTQSSTAATGVTLKNKCNMMLGSSFDSNAQQTYFEGELDDWCFYRKA